MGVSSGLKVLLRHPGILRIFFGYVLANVRKDARRELKWLRRMREYATKRGRPEPPKFRAREGELLLRTGDRDGARAIFAEVLSRHKGSKEPLDHHLTMYAHYYLSMIDLKPDQAAYWSRRAADLGLARIDGVTAIPPPLPNVLKEEFDQDIRDLNKRLGIEEPR